MTTTNLQHPVGTTSGTPASTGQPAIELVRADQVVSRRARRTRRGPHRRSGRDRGRARPERCGEVHHQRVDPRHDPSRHRTGAGVRPRSGAGRSRGSGRCHAAGRGAAARRDRPRRAAADARTARPPASLPEIVERADLGSFLKTKTDKLSGGQAQRLRYALAIMPDPELLILDEPTVGMDVEIRRAFWQSMEDFTAERPDRAVRHPLSRRGRRGRRSDRGARRGPDRGRRHRGRDQVAGGRPHHRRGRRQRVRRRSSSSCPDWARSPRSAPGC